MQKQQNHQLTNIKANIKQSKYSTERENKASIYSGSTLLHLHPLLENHSRISIHYLTTFGWREIVYTTYFCGLNKKTVTHCFMDQTSKPSLYFFVGSTRKPFTSSFLRLTSNQFFSKAQQGNLYNPQSNTLIVTDCVPKTQVICSNHSKNNRK